MAYPAGPQLRPLGVGERLDAAIKIFGRNFLPMAKAVLVLAVPAGVLDALITVSTALPHGTTVTTGPFGTTTATTANGGDYWAYGAGLLVVFLVAEVVTAIATATCYRIVGSSYLGQPVEWRRALRDGTARFFSVLWVIVLTSLVLVAPALVVAVLALIGVAAHAAVVAVVVGVVGGMAWVVFAVWFGTCTRLAVPTVMIEELRGWKAIRRSIALCRRSWWSVFGTQLLAALIVGLLSVALGIVTAVVAVAWHDSTTAGAISGFFTRTTSLVVATPFTAAVLVVIAIDLRVRKEGFDLQLLASQLGAPPTRAALDFMRREPQLGWGPTPGGWPTPRPSGYPPPQTGYPPPSPPWVPPAPTGYPPPSPPWVPPAPNGYPPPPTPAGPPAPAAPAPSEGTGPEGTGPEETGPGGAPPEDGTEGQR